MTRIFMAVALAVAGVAGPAVAQDLVGSYVAYIGADDLYNSRGQRLTQPWQVLRQDRANFHRFGIRQRGDQGDSFFADANNRAAMERMIMNGYIDPVAARELTRGGATVLVEIYGRGNRGDSLRVTVVD